MDCEARTLVRCDGGPAAAKVKEHYAAHVKYVAELLKDGSLLMAGPTTDGSGIFVFKSTDKAEVDKLIQGEPFVANQVLTCKLSGWQQCVAKK
jgi:uncharacterized protein YciI